MTMPTDWGFGIPQHSREEIPQHSREEVHGLLINRDHDGRIGNSDLADLYEQEGFGDLATIHRLTPNQARTLLVYMAGSPEMDRGLAYIRDRFEDVR